MTLQPFNPYPSAPPPSPDDELDEEVATLAECAGDFFRAMALALWMIAQVAFWVAILWFIIACCGAMWSPR
jgi:hypothetical protein